MGRDVRRAQGSNLRRKVGLWVSLVVLVVAAHDGSGAVKTPGRRGPEE